MRLKKYRNRKIWDREGHCYVDHSQIHAHVASGGDMECWNDRTKTDYTAETLLECLHNKQLWDKSASISSAAVVRIIQAGGMLAYIERLECRS